MNGCGTVEELIAFLIRRDEEISIGNCIARQESDVSSLSEAELECITGLYRDFGALKKLLSTVETRRDQLRHDLACKKVTLERLRIMKEQLEEQKENQPRFLPSPPADPEITETVTEEQPSARKSVCFEEPESIKKNVPAKRGKNFKGLLKTSSGTNSAKKKPKQTAVPKIDYITTEEFASIPRYMLGRIKYEQINSQVDELNALTTRRYKILDTPPNKQSSENMKRFTRMMDEPEVKEAKDAIWFDSEDLKDLAPSLKITLFNKVLPILRHCQRLRQIRVGKKERYIVLT